MSASPVWRFRGTATSAALVVAFLYLPIVTLVVLSFSNGESAQGGLSQGVSLRWYRALLHDEEMQRVLQNSLTIASFTAVAATLVACLAALGLARNASAGSRRAEAFIMVPLVIPEIVLGVSLLLFFAFANVRLGLATIAVAHVVLVLPVAYVPIRARLQDLDKTLLEAAADLYATPFQAFRRVTLPLIAPGIAVGAILAFIGSLSDVVVAYFVSGPGATTLPVYALSMVRIGVTPLINAVSTLLLLASAIVLTALYLFNRSLDKRTEIIP